MNDKSENIKAVESASHKQAGRLVLRIGNGTMACMQPYDNGSVDYRPYIVKSGVSMAANLRQAMREMDLLVNRGEKVLLSVATPVILLPVDEYMDDENFDADLVYNQTITGYESDEKVGNVLPDLNAVALFSLNKDLKLVVEDNFADVRVQNVMQPVWSHFYRRGNPMGQRRKLYGYFHDGCVDVFGFQQRRFRFSNTFDATHAHDALYYILFAWNQMAFDNENDELYLIGETEHKEWLLTKLRTYLRRVYAMSPAAQLNRAPVSMVDGLDFDMMV